MSDLQPRRRLVSTFGLGLYDGPYARKYFRSKYTFENQTSSEFQLIQQALIELFKIDSVGGVCTSDVRQEWYEKDLQAIPRTSEDEAVCKEMIEHLTELSQRATSFQKSIKEQLNTWTSLQRGMTAQHSNRWRDECGLNVSFDDVTPEDMHAGLCVRMYEVPKGETPDELYELFNQYTHLLSREVLPDLGESEPPDEIIVDVSNGLRIQPIILLSAVLFVQQEWRRCDNPFDIEPMHVPKIRLVYSAFRNKDKPNEIWEATSFLDIQTINQAISNTILFGRGDALEQCVDMMESTDVLEEFSFKDIAQAIQEVTQDLQTIRTLDLCNISAPNLKEVLKEQIDRLPNKWQMLLSTLRELSAWADDFTFEKADEQSTFDGIHSVDGVQFTARLAKKYRELGNIPAQLALLREGWVTGLVVNNGGESVNRTKYPPEPSLGQCRNTVLHAQFEQNAKNHVEIFRMSHELQHKFEEFAKEVVPPNERKQEEPSAFIWLGTVPSFEKYQSIIQHQLQVEQLTYNNHIRKSVHECLKDKKVPRRVRTLYDIIQSNWSEPATVILGPSVMKDIDNVVLLVNMLQLNEVATDIFYIHDQSDEPRLSKLQINPRYLMPKSPDV